MTQNARVFFDNNYLDRCQVATPLPIVEWVWKMIHEIRPTVFQTVLDLGCGDARFSLFGNYKKYTGVEIDEESGIHPGLPIKAQIHYGCALLTPLQGYDICIGNPPYVRHHDIDEEWQRRVARVISKLIDGPIDLRANAFLYFMAKSLASTNNSGLVALVIPFEWVSRPSAEWVRNYIRMHRWEVKVYRLPEGIFPRVLTTSSLTIIDKSATNNQWKYFDVDDGFTIREVSNSTGTRYKPLVYSQRNNSLYAQRGLSPGTQKVFCLTEEERLYHGLKVGQDVCPCVTSLRGLPSNFKVLSSDRFWEYYVSQKARCWLIRSDRDMLSDRLKGYLNSVDPDLRSTSTCRSRPIWYRYKRPQPAKLLFSTGFVKQGPQVLENPLHVTHLGGVGGIYGNQNLPYRMIANRIRDIDFENRIIHHSNSLKKLEINQMNTALQEILDSLHE